MPERRGSAHVRASPVTERSCQIGTLTVFLAHSTGSRQHSDMRSLSLGVTRRATWPGTWLPAAGVIAALTGNARADADSLDDVLGPREIAVGEALRGAATGASSVDLNPAGLSLNRELVFEGGYGYRASDSASLVGVSACDSTNAVPGCFFYEYAGSNPELGAMTMHRTTHLGGLSLSRALVPRILVGATAKYFRFSSEMPRESKASGTTFDLGATIRLNELFNLGVSAQNLWASTESAQFPRAVGGGAELFVRGGDGQSG